MPGTRKTTAKASKKELPPALRANADKLKNGEPLSPGRKKRSAQAASKMQRAATPKKKPQIRSAGNRGK